MLAKREWTTGMFDCCDDIPECVYAFFCGWCYMCDMAKAMNESCCSCMFGGMVPMRTKIRTERGIEGQVWKDHFAVHCCAFCTMVQMGREIKATSPCI